MTQDDVIRIARQTASHGTAHPCGDTTYHFYDENLALFADQMLEEVALEIASIDGRIVLESPLITVVS